MSSRKSIQLAIAVMTRQRNAAGATLMKCQAALANAEHQMLQLHSYSSETQSRWKTTINQQTTVELLKNHHQFMNRLNHAMDLQQVTLQGLSNQLDKANAHLRHVDTRLLELSKFESKKKLAAERQVARFEQKQMDELAAVQLTHRVKQNPTGNFP